MRKFIEKNRYEILLVVQAAIVNGVAYYGGKLLSRNMYHRCLATGLDAAIPLLPWTILIYFGGMLFWIVILPSRSFRKSAPICLNSARPSVCVVGPV